MAERQVREAISRDDEVDDVDIDMDGGGITVDTDKGNLAIGGSDLPDGFPSEMPIYDPTASPVVAMGVVEDGEERLVASYHLDVDDEDDVLAFFRRELPPAGWTVEESDEPSDSFTVLKVEGHGFIGGITIMSASNVLNVTYTLARSVD